MSETSVDKWIVVQDQAAMFDYNFEYWDELPRSSYAARKSRYDSVKVEPTRKFHMKSGEFEIGCYAGSRTVQIDPKSMKNSIEDASRGEKNAYWTQGGKEVFVSKSKPWEYLPEWNENGKGIAFGIKLGGCYECVSPEDWTFVLEHLESDKSYIRLVVKGKVSCECGGGGYHVVEEITYIAEPFVEG